MNAITSNYELVKDEDAGFIDGTLPSWLTNTSAGGTVNVKSQDGGVATLSTGTGSVGDSGAVEGPPIVCSTFDAISLEVEFGQNSAAANSTEATSSIGLIDADSPQGMYHMINNELASSANTFQFGGTGGTSRTIADTRTFLRTENTTSEIFWDTVDQWGIHRLQDCFAQRIDSNSMNKGATFIPQIKINTENTASDKEFYIYNVAIKYWNKKDN